MQNTRFLFVRHGESEGNLNNIFLGHTDLDLTELGHSQAELTARYLAEADIDVLYSSDLKRAWQTAEHIAAKKDMSIIADSMFREIYAGVWEGMRYVDIERCYTKEFDIWRNNLGLAVCTKGESVKEVYKRVRAEIFRLAEMYEGMTVCVATHATPIRVLRADALGLDMDNVKASGPANASVTVIDVCDGKLKMVEDGACEHLKGVVTLPNNV